MNEMFGDSEESKQAFYAEIDSKRGVSWRNIKK